MGDGAESAVPGPGLVEPRPIGVWRPQLLAPGALLQCDPQDAGWWSCPRCGGLSLAQNAALVFGHACPAKAMDSSDSAAERPCSDRGSGTRRPRFLVGALLAMTITAIALVGPAGAGARLADPDRPVLLVVSGLTAVDAAITWYHRGHRGPIWMVSRRGLLPQAHGELPARADDLGEFEVAGPTSARQMSATLRGLSRRAIARHGDCPPPWTRGVRGPSRSGRRCRPASAAASFAISSRIGTSIATACLLWSPAWCAA